MDKLLSNLFNVYFDNINENDVSKFENRFNVLLYEHISEMRDYIRKLSLSKSSNEVIKYISNEKNIIKAYKDKVLTRERITEEKISLSLEEYKTICNIDKEEIAIKSMCNDKIDKIKYDILNASYLKLMELHREYSDDLLFELKRFDIDYWGYNDIPFNLEDKAVCWIERLINEYFDKLTNTINEEKDLNEISTLIKTKIQIFKQIKNELSEKGNSFFVKNMLAESGDLEEQDIRTNIMISFSELFYNRQLQYIDDCLDKLETLLENYLPKSAPITISQQENQSQLPTVQQYSFDTQKISTIYDFCISTKVFGSSISEIDLINSIANADFQRVYEFAEQTGGKTKCKYLICYLNNFVIKNANWYIETAHSINTEPTKCSGVNAPLKWKNEIIALKL